MEFQRQFFDAIRRSGSEPKRITDLVNCYENKLIEDSRGRKTIYYQFDDRGDVAFGRWYDCRMGEGGSWFSRTPSSWNDEQKAKWKAEREAQEEKEKQEREERQNTVADEAKAIWTRSAKVVSHVYLEGKKTKPAGAMRVNDGLLVIPAVDADGKIWTVQTISVNGEKKFLFGGRKNGCFFPIDLKLNNKPPIIYVCEGVATGLSIYEAINAPVCVAFDAGNLKHVAKEVSKKWPMARLVICCDNDAWTLKHPRAKELIDIDQNEVSGDDPRWNVWREKGWLDNPGLRKGGQAAEEQYMIWPEFDEVDFKDKPTDFNDAACLYGIEYVRNRLQTVEVLIFPVDGLQAPSAELVERIHPPMLPAAEVEIIDDHNFETVERTVVSTRSDRNPDWFTNFIWDKEPDRKLASMMEIKGRHDGKSLSNCIVFIENHFKGMFVLNEFSDELTLKVCPPWIEEKDFYVRRIRETDIIEMTSTLEHYGFAPNTDRTFKAIVSVAERHKIHPAREYMSNLQWDGVRRLETWLQRYAGAVYQPEKYVSTVGTMWIVAAVARIFEPGKKFDHMLILEGPQNIGKSTILRELATFGEDKEESYFSDGITMHEIDKPNALQIIQGRIILEFAELEGMDKAGDAQLKRWITKQSDEIVKKYEKFVTLYPRQFVIAGTTNEDTWLKDSTGNRRYWPVKCRKTDLQALKEDKTQLWAEAKYLYESGYKIYLSDDDEVYQLAMAEQSVRMVGDTWAEVLEYKLKTQSYVSYTDLYEFLGIPIKDRNASTDVRIRSIMRGYKWEYKQAYAQTGKKERVWVKS